jgi:Leucine-rich repeat (LRR) protein
MDKLIINHPNEHFFLHILPQLTFLKVLELKCQSLQEIPPDTIWPRQLEQLAFYCPQLTTIPIDLLFLPHLVSFKIIGGRIPQFPSYHPKHPPHSRLKNLQFTNISLQTLPLWLGYFKELEVLTLNHNHLQIFPSELVLLRKLERINLDHNRLHHFPEVLEQLPSLRHLSLDKNPLISSHRHYLQHKYHLRVL